MNVNVAGIIDRTTSAVNLEAFMQLCCVVDVKRCHLQAWYSNLIRPDNMRHEFLALDSSGFESKITGYGRLGLTKEEKEKT
jgi:hypothetical protein